MKHLLFLAFLAFAGNAFSQAPQDSTLTLGATLHDACFVAASMPPGSDVCDAIAAAADGVQDSTTIVNVVLTQRQVVDVQLALRVLPEYLAADINARLLAMVMPMLSTRPWLAEQLFGLRAQGEQAISTTSQRGKRLIAQKLAAFKRNQ